MDNNAEIFRKGLLEYSKRIEQQILMVLDNVAKKVLDTIDGNNDMPWFTGNLLDSTGIGVYYHGTLRKYTPRKIANEPQYYAGEEDIWGFKKLEEALMMGQTLYSQGIWIVIYTAVPYAFALNEFDDNHEGFFDNYVLDELVETTFQQITKLR